MSIPASQGYDTISHTNNTGVSINYTFLVNLNLGTTDFKASFNSDSGGRGRASKTDGTTELACDFLYPNSSTNECWAVVNWGSLASGSTATIRLFAPNTSNSEYVASDTYGQYNAYRSAIKGYYPKGGGSDRTINQSTLTAVGSVTEGDTSTVYGDATDYDGAAQYFAGASTQVSPITLMCLGNPDSLSLAGLMNLADSAESNQQLGLSTVAGGNATSVNFAGSFEYATSTTASTVGSWWHYAARLREYSYKVCVFKRLRRRDTYINWDCYRR